MHVEEIMIILRKHLNVGDDVEFSPEMIVCYLLGVKDGHSDYSEQSWTDSDLMDLMGLLDDVLYEQQNGSE